MPRVPGRNQPIPEDLTARRRQLIKVQELFRRLGDKWSLSVIARIGQSTIRFADLRRNIDGISNRMLTATLRNLEHEGLVARTVHPTTPPQVEYRLTPLGTAMLKAVDSLAVWYDGHSKEPTDSPGT